MKHVHPGCGKSHGSIVGKAAAILSRMNHGIDVSMRDVAEDFQLWGGGNWKEYVLNLERLERSLGGLAGYWAIK